MAKTLNTIKKLYTEIGESLEAGDYELMAAQADALALYLEELKED